MATAERLAGNAHVNDSIRLHSRTPLGDVIPTMASFIRPSISSMVASASPACRRPSAEKHVGDPDGLRADVLRLHAMAHTLVNGAPLTTNVENLAIWELADALESELMEIEEGAKRAMKLLRPLLKLAPDE